jgi:hypothetical protein
VRERAGPHRPLVEELEVAAVAQRLGEVDQQRREPLLRMEALVAAGEEDADVALARLAGQQPAVARDEVARADHVLGVLEVFDGAARRVVEEALDHRLAPDVDRRLGRERDAPELARRRKPLLVQRRQRRLRGPHARRGAPPPDEARRVVPYASGSPPWPT